MKILADVLALQSLENARKKEKKKKRKKEEKKKKKEGKKDDHRHEIFGKSVDR